VRDQASDSRTASVNGEFIGNFELGPTKHKFLTYSNFSARDNNTFRLRYNIPTIRLPNPVYADDTVASRLSVDILLINTDNSEIAWNWGVQDNISFWDDRLIVVGGARFDWSRDELNDFRRDNFTIDINSNWSTKYGLVFHPWKNVSFFVDHSETFTPRSGVDELGNQALDLEGTSEEIGIKVDLWDSRFVLTISSFTMILDNFQTTDFIIVGDTQFRVFLDAGANNTEGWELDLAWNPTDSFSLIYGYGDLTSRSRRGGRRFRHVAEGPNHQVFARPGGWSGLLLCWCARGRWRRQFLPSVVQSAGSDVGIPIQTREDSGEYHQP